MIKNIIFDLCGPIIRIDVGLISRKLHAFGVPSTTGYHDLVASGLVQRYDAGLLSPQQFAEQARQVLGHPLSDAQLWDAWNTVITHFDPLNRQCIERLHKRGYRLLVLSNSDQVNAALFTQYLNQQAGYDFTSTCFVDVCYSYQFHCRKPAPQIFRMVLGKNHLKPAQTLFIDDTLQHCLGAQSVGLQTYHLRVDEGETLPMALESLRL